MPIEVLIADEQESSQLSEPFFDRVSSAVQRILIDHQVQDAEISVAIVTDERIHEMNRDYLQHDYPTDVITFPLSDDEQFLEGEIVVSIDTAIRESAAMEWSSEEELLLYIVHGTLHLVGFDDQSDEDRLEMKSMERKYLIEFGIPGAENHS